MDDLTGKTSYAYNDEGELTGLRQGGGSLITYIYDDYGNITKLTHRDAKDKVISSYAYACDDGNYITEETIS